MEPQTIPVNQNLVQDKQRKMIRLIVILAVVTIVVLVLATTLAPKDITSEKLSLALARHQEMTRVLEEFADNARSGETRQLVANSRLVLLSGASELSSAGVSVSIQQAGIVKTEGIDESLQEASRNNRFDEAITEFLTSNIEANRADLSSIQAELSDDKQIETVKSLLNDYGGLL